MHVCALNRREGAAGEHMGDMYAADVNGEHMSPRVWGVCRRHMRDTQAHLSGTGGHPLVHTTHVHHHVGRIAKAESSPGWSSCDLIHRNSRGIQPLFSRPKTPQEHNTGPKGMFYPEDSGFDHRPPA